MQIEDKCPSRTCLYCDNWKGVAEPADPDYAEDRGFCTVQNGKMTTSTDTCQAFDSRLKQTEFFEQKIHYNTRVWCRKGQNNLHRDLCLCFSCAKWSQEPEQNCPLSRTLFALSREYHLTIPPLECPYMEPLS